MPLQRPVPNLRVWVYYVYCCAQVLKRYVLSMIDRRRIGGYKDIATGCPRRAAKLRR